MRASDGGLLPRDSALPTRQKCPQTSLECTGGSRLTMAQRASPQPEISPLHPEDNQPPPTALRRLLERRRVFPSPGICAKLLCITPSPPRPSSPVWPLHTQNVWRFCLLTNGQGATKADTSPADAAGRQQGQEKPRGGGEKHRLELRRKRFQGRPTAQSLRGAC